MTIPNPAPWATLHPTREAVDWKTVYVNQTNHYEPPSWPQYDLHALERHFVEVSDRQRARRYHETGFDVTQYVVQTYLPRGYGRDHVRAELGRACRMLSDRWVDLIGATRPMTFIGGVYSIEPMPRPSFAQAWEMVILISLRDDSARLSNLWSDYSHPPPRPADPLPNDDEAAVLAARAARREARQPAKRSGPKVDLGLKEIGP